MYTPTETGFSFNDSHQVLYALCGKGCLPKTSKFQFSTCDVVRTKRMFNPLDRAKTKDVPYELQTCQPDHPEILDRLLP